MIVRIPIELAKPGMVTSEPVFSAKTGQMIASENIGLTKNHIMQIKNHNVASICVIGDNPVEKTKKLSIHKPRSINIIEEDGKHVLKIDSQHARETHTIAIERTAHIFKELYDGGRIDRKAMHNLADNLFNEVIENPQAFSNLSAIRTKDEYTYIHSVDVGVLSLLVGHKLNFSNDDLKILTISGLLHDIGKMKIPSELLHKEGVFSNEERNTMMRHSELGYSMLQEQDLDPRIARVVREHHEWVNGSGYPDVIKGNNMHPFSKIVAVAETYNALTTDSLYRPVYPPYKAVQIISGDVGSHFDAAYAKLFIQVIGIYPNSTHVRLSNGSIGRVIDQNIDHPLRPIVQVLRNKAGRKVQEIKIIDLAQENKVAVSEVLFNE